jgi:hypothetical protein
MDLARAPRGAPLTARKKGSGYENGDIYCCRRQHTILNMKYCVPAFTCVQSLWPSYVQSIEISICVFSVCLFVCMYVCKDVVIPGK